MPAVGPQAAATAAPHMMQLPPSPELGSLQAQTASSLPRLSLDSPKSHFRSVSNYQSFSPEAISCSSQQVAAIAGLHGVALFSVYKPHKPLLILPHKADSQREPLTSLQFQPNSLLLGAARGSGVLVWDASGQSLSPLLGRLGHNQSKMHSSETTAANAKSTSTSIITTNNNITNNNNNNNTTTNNNNLITNNSSSSSSSNRITGMAWNNHCSHASVSKTIATATTTTACLWDISSSFTRPALQFGKSRASPFVAVACRDEQAATLDAAGIVRVYDVRLVNRGAGAVSTFCAHSHRGIGLVAMAQCDKDDSTTNITTSMTTTSSNSQSHNNSPSWMTWGLDHDEKVAPGSTSVKLWSPVTEEDARPPSLEQDDSYWFMDGSLSSPVKQQKASALTHTTVGGHKLVGQHTSPSFHLACARICPLPLKDGIVTVGVSDQGHWQADLWRFNNDKGKDVQNTRTTSLDGSFGLENVSSFRLNEDPLLQTLLGGGRFPNSLGSIIGSELAMVQITSSSRQHQYQQHHHQQQDKGEENSETLELLLCSLSENGYVTTHAIPQVDKLNPSHHREDLQNKDLEHSPIRWSNDGLPARGIFSKDKEVEDAAFTYRSWNAGGLDGTRSGLADDATALLREELKYRPETKMRSLSPQKIVAEKSTKKMSATPYKSAEEDPVATISRGVEGGMQFDMDVSLAYGSVTTKTQSGVRLVGVTDAPATLTLVSNPSITSDGVSVQVGLSHSAPVVQQVNADKVPVPRLCGAVFGSGGGGLICFHNGEVRKMWTWYQKSNAKRRMPGIGGSTIFSPANDPYNQFASRTSIKKALDETERKNAVTRENPRTLQDLMDMTITAKEAQWGEGNDGTRSPISLDSETDSSAEDLFDDDSLGGSNSSDSDDSSVDKETSKSDMYKTYFGKSRRAVAVLSEFAKDKSATDGGSPATSPRSSNRKFATTKTEFGGLSAEVLAPIVCVTHAHDQLVMNGQCPELAERWKLGSWDLVVMNDFLDASLVSNHGSFHNSSSIEPDRSERRELETKDTCSTGTAEYFSSHDDASYHIEQVRSDPLLNKEGVSEEEDFRQNFDNTAVRDGELTSRPNRQESMVFLRKLFNHQGDRRYSAMTSPPDAPMLRPKRFAPDPDLKGVASSHAILQSVSRGKSTRVDTVKTCSANSKHESGVFMLQIHSKPEDGAKMSLINTKMNCLHNATACTELDQSEKADVWYLLAQMVDNIMADKSDAFSGWGGGGALRQELVGNILRNFEALGDVQMLASIACVLGGKPSSNSKSTHSLLPGVQVEKYDAYIRRYADLLYSWGLLTIRAELNKHLVCKPSGQEGEQLVSLDSSCTRNTNVRSSGIAFAPLCSRCNIEANPETNICSSCQDYAFRCSICTNAVRGLFTICIICGHGGHVAHIMPWFEKQLVCPTGCGCACVLNTRLGLEQQLPDLADEHPIRGSL